LQADGVAAGRRDAWAPQVPSALKARPLTEPPVAVLAQSEKTASVWRKQPARMRWEALPRREVAKLKKPTQTTARA
jgi:hypothetical protein